MKNISSRSGIDNLYTLVLDEQKYYFRGDRVRGRLVIIPSKPLKFNRIKFEFFGRIKTYISSKKQDEYYFFKQDSIQDVQTGYLKVGETYTCPFDFNLPVDVALPSCTEGDTNMGGIIEYIITATIDRLSRLTASVHVPVLERLDISKTELMEPVWNKVNWHPLNDSSGQIELSASIPHKGYTRDQTIPVSVDLLHYQSYQRTKGLTISLIRCTRVLCKEKAYLLSPTTISSVKVDNDIQHTCGQTYTLTIPQHTSPTINLNARLIQVDYRIEVRVELHDRLIPDNLICLELPIVIGTLPFPSLPPNHLDPKFVKGVTHFGQENQPKQNEYLEQPKQQSRLSLSFTTMDRSTLKRFSKSFSRHSISIPPAIPSTSQSTSRLFIPTPKLLIETTSIPSPSPPPTPYLALSLGGPFSPSSDDGSIDSTPEHHQLTSISVGNPTGHQNIYRQLSTFSNYRRSFDPSGPIFKPESTIEGLELSATYQENDGSLSHHGAFYDKPHQVDSFL